MSELTPEQLKTQKQVQLAELGQAEGQCAGCGSYRADGQPPVLHKPGCKTFPEGADPNAGWGP
ncbi:hypothetical protein [Kribbella deserti]|uniref:Uncharacterized protein n=1 Tax=Kribbella deserti TaxID=1926257 RepID=A0ABV6QNH1_9ACTN